MELAASIDPYICPTAAFLDKTNCDLFVSAQAEYEEAGDSNTSGLIWHLSTLNPRNRIDSLEVSAQGRWRIDGCAGQGRQFFVLPIFMLPDIPVRRMDVFIPCQSKHPAPLRRTLQSSEAFNVTGRGVNELGIAKYVLKVLERWSTNQVYFQDIFYAMPFGSKIVIENIAFNIKDVRVRWVPNTGFEKQLLSSQRLQQMWNLSGSSWPSMIDLSLLQHHAQLHDTISVVQIAKLHGTKKFIFKSSLRRTKYTYHELKLLLTMHPHPNIISKPTYLVTKSGSTTDEDCILGFLLEYHSSGNLKQVLDSRPLQSTLCEEVQYRWARQVLQTLQIIIDGPARFYSELKPDNLIISHLNGDIIFIDFEQAGNWDTFSAPEIFYVEQLAKLAVSKTVPRSKRTLYKALLHINLPKTTADDIYSNPARGYYDAWNSLGSREQEASMVYSAGKLLWCIFERCSHTRNSTDENYHTKVGVEFPHFCSTPPRLRRLIELCTMGSPDWTSTDVRIVREGPVFFPQSQKGKLSGDKHPIPSPAKAMDAAKEMWTCRVRSMEAYVDAKSRWVQGVASSEDEVLLGFPLRPMLSDVLVAIIEEEKISAANSGAHVNKSHA